LPLVESSKEVVDRAEFGNAADEVFGKCHLLLSTRP
jgi:hypothetical protein